MPYRIGLMSGCTCSSWSIFLALLSFYSLFSSCKQREADSNLQDLAMLRNDKAVIIYHDQSTGTVVRAECPPIREEFRKVSGFDMRDFCKENIARYSFKEFHDRALGEFLRKTGKASLSHQDRMVFNYALSRLDKGPLNKDGGEQNKGANAIDMNKRQILDPYIAFNDPALLHSYFEFLEAFDAIFPQAQPAASVPEAPRRLVVERSTLSELPRPIEENRRLIDQNIAFRDDFYLNGFFETQNEGEFNGVQLQFVGTESSCMASVFRVEMVGIDGNSSTLFRSPEGYDRFFVPDLVERRLRGVRLSVVNHHEKAFQCRLIVEGLKYVWQEKDPHTGHNMPVTRENRNQVMKEMMADRVHRLNHYLWHASRNMWNLPSTTSQDRQLFTEWGFRPPRPLIYSGQSIDYAKTAESGAGEDFLYMHRYMIEALKKKLGPMMYSPWTELPTPQSREFPVHMEMVSQKMDAGYRQMMEWQRKYTDPVYLRTVSLSRLGVELEFEIHNLFHIRFSRPQSESRPVSDDPLRRSQGAPWVWDDVKYEHLSDSYSAHVNPVFWALHGWVDQRIEDWLRVHGYTRAATNCGSDPRCYTWRGQWLGIESWVSHSGHGDGVRPIGHDSSEIPDFSKASSDLIRRISENSFMVTR